MSDSCNLFESPDHPDENLPVGITSANRGSTMQFPNRSKSVVGLMRTQIHATLFLRQYRPAIQIHLHSGIDEDYPALKPHF